MDDDFLEELKSDFLMEAEDLVETAENCFLRLEKHPENKDILDELFRVYHNIKGSSKAVGFDSLSHFSHQAENILVDVRDGKIANSPEINDLFLLINDTLKTALNKLAEQIDPDRDFAPALARMTAIQEKGKPSQQPPTSKADTSNRSIESNSSEKSSAPVQVPDEVIRVPSSKIHSLIDYFGEQVILQSRLSHLLRQDINSNIDDILVTLSQIDKISADIQQSMFSLRMVKIQPIFHRMERVVRDTARLTQKQVEFHSEGEHTELDKTIVDALAAPLTHMLRNAVDHGIEIPQERKSAGKAEMGRITLKAFRNGSRFYIEVIDDGKGLDLEKIRRLAIEKSIISPNDNLSNKELSRLIFHSGLSTKPEATSVSGRGVGMDVVQNMFRSLKGECDIETQVGQGTRFTVSLPLTLVLFNGTVIQVSNKRFILPNSSYTETVAVHEEQIIASDSHHQVLQIRDKTVPVFYLHSALGYAPEPSSRKRQWIAAVAPYDQGSAAVLFDALLYQERITLKQLRPEFPQIPGVSGATILGDGQVALVLELNDLIKSCEAAA